MSQYFDGSGERLNLGEPLGAGGEGTVYRLADEDGYVAKIYHQAVSSEKADKLRAMADLASGELTAFAACPVLTIHEGRRGPIVGAVLPRINDRLPIHNLYGPAHRKLLFPDKDWAFLVHVAMNCAAAFESLHRKSLVIGDVNQGNLLVSQTGTVALIDCDSFQISSNGRVFPCEVGVAHFTPPELQGQSFRGVVRAPNHDNFGLAVLLFHLLFLGRHPFAGRFAGPGDMPIERAIREYRFAFGRDAAGAQMAPPPDTLDMDQIAPTVAALFEQAFGRGSEQPDARPSAKFWYAALKGLRTQLRTCAADDSHRYEQSLAACPWCAIMKRKGPNFFASVTVCRLMSGTFEVTADLVQTWEQIEALAPPPDEFPESLWEPLPSPPAPPPPPTVARWRPWLTSARAAAYTGLAMAALTAWQGAALYLTLPACLALLGFWGWVAAFSPYGKEIAQLRRRWQARGAEMDRLEAEWDSMAFHYRTQFDVAKTPLVAAYAQLQRLQETYNEEYAALERDKVNRQRDRYLQGVFLSEADIDGIEAGRLPLLASYGFESAYDIEEPRLKQSRLFSYPIIESLLAWRKKVEGAFRYNAAQGVPEADRNALISKSVQTRTQLQHLLVQGLEQLQEVVGAATGVLQDIERRYQVERVAASGLEAQLSALT